MSPQPGLNTSTRIFHCLTAIALMLPLAILPAAGNERDDWYDIEIIVFEHKAGPGAAAELWTPDPGAPAVETAIEPAPPPGMLPPLLTESMPVADVRMPYRQLDASELRLERLHNRLTVSGDYEPRLHLGWRQPANPDQPVRGVRVRMPEKMSVGDHQLPAGALFIDTRAVRAPLPRAAVVDGVVSLQRSRFLHLSLDLLLLEPSLETAETGLFSIFSRRESRQKVYRLQAQRRIRANEVHYFDHPVIGVLVQVTPHEEQR